MKSRCAAAVRLEWNRFSRQISFLESLHQSCNFRQVSQFKKEVGFVRNVTRKAENSFFFFFALFWLRDILTAILRRHNKKNVWD